MPISSHDLLTLAVRLKSESNECSFRSAASRAYYAYYHVCRDFAKKRTLPEPPPDAKGEHEKVIQRFLAFQDDINHTNQIEVRRIGYLLRYIKLIRTDADYYLEKEFTIGRVDETFEYIEKIKEAFGKITV